MLTSPKKKKTKKGSKSKEDSPVSDTEPTAEDKSEMLAAMLASGSEQYMRLTGVYGDINEEKCSEALHSLFILARTGKKLVPATDEEDSDLVEMIEPIEFVVSTYGGSANEMFAVYDTIRLIQEDGCEIHTLGLGKVMSAGVLILASGTKGKRRIGSNTRLMLHPIQGGTAGPFPHMSDDMRTMKKAQEHYIGVLSRETKLSIKEIRRIVNRRKDTYFTAHEAIEMGIADELL